jgi:hypothetical protein
MNNQICAKYGCNYELDFDGQVTCSNCGSMDDAKTPPSWGDTPVSFEE